MSITWNPVHCGWRTVPAASSSSIDAALTGGGGTLRASQASRLPIAVQSRVMVPPAGFARAHQVCLAARLMGRMTLMDTVQGLNNRQRLIRVWCQEGKHAIRLLLDLDRVHYGQ